MSIVVYWLIESETDSLAPGIDVTSEFREFGDSELMAALAFTEGLRKRNKRHVTISTELSNNISKAGVDTVENGKTPDGEDYEWSKKQRGAGPRSVTS